MPLSAAVQLQSTIQKLQAERQGHENAIAEIDQVFEQFGIKPGVKRGRKPGSRNKKPSVIKVSVKPVKPVKVAKPVKTVKPVEPAKTISKSKPNSGLAAPDFVLGLIKKKGPLGAKRSDLSKAWGADGRKGAVHVILHNLTRSKKVKATALKGGDMLFKIV